MSVFGEVMSIMPSILWFILVTFIVWRYRRSLEELMDIALWRLKAGAPLKVSVFELGTVQ